MMLPLGLSAAPVDLHFGTSKRSASFWSALTAADAIFGLSSQWSELLGHGVQCLVGLFAAYVLSRYTFWGRNALIVRFRCLPQSDGRCPAWTLLMLWGRTACWAGCCARTESK